METSEMSLLSQALQTPKDTEKLLKMLKDSGLSANDLKYNWNINARPKQLLAYDKNWITTLALAGRGFGKCLDLDTVIPTATGYTTMREIKLGDQLFDEHGKICNVISVHQIKYDLNCYEVEFSSGEKIVTDSEHNWFVWDKAARKAHGRAIHPTKHPHKVTTQEIKENLFIKRKDKHRELNFSIKNMKSFNLVEKKLSIAPYTFGVWLGDGCSNSAAIWNQDQAVWDRINQDGYTLKEYNIKKLKDKVLSCKRIIEITTMNLKELKVYKNKHIPIEYLRSSYKQRLEILTGLIDSDGHIAKNGNVEFTTVFPKLAENFMELVSSLGIKATTIRMKSYSYNEDNKKQCKDRYRIHFTPYIKIANIPYKAANIKKPGKQATRQGHRYITAVNKVKSVPVRCIGVDSVNHLFCITKSFIPTCNTRLLSEFIRQEVYQNSKKHIGLIAATASDCRDTLVLGTSGILACCPKHERPIYQSSKAKLIFRMVL